MKLTKAEEELMAMILREVRHAVAAREQLQILFDPFHMGGGAHLSFCMSAAGYTATIEGEFRSRKKRKRRP